MIKYISLTALISIFNFSTLLADTDEWLRAKLETSPTTQLTAFGEIIHCQKSLTTFYLSHEFNPVWNKQWIEPLVNAIESADKEGLNPQDYHIVLIKNFGTNPAENEMEEADRELIMSDALLLYVSHLLSGKINPKTIDADWHVANREGNAVEHLEEAISTGKIKEAIHKAMPIHPIYLGLRKTLANYRTLEYDGWSTIADGASIKPGMTDTRIPEIRLKLKILGDLDAKADLTSELYDETLHNAVQKFQLRHGIDSDGAIGDKSIKQLNVSPKDRMAQIEANLERWRWLRQQFGEYYILVNIADYSLEVKKYGRTVRKHRVIAGKPARNTPVFSSKMQYLVFNPTWTIPPGILNGDVLPATKKDVSYLAKKRIQVMDKQGNVIDPTTIDWNNPTVKSYTYRQPSGPDNALGAVKFMFPNEFSIYLHDTPSKELFNKSERAFSSGCIRVEEPLALAEFLINDAEKWNRNAIDKTIKTNQTQTVYLKDQPNVYLLYWTAWVDETGTVQFRNDIYNRDKRVIDRLNSPAPNI